MTFSSVIGFLTAVVCGVFSVIVLNRYRIRGGAHLLAWGLGLLLYFLGGLTEVLLSFGWNEWAFRLWYWSGALMVPPVLGQGTLHLLVRKPYVALSASIVVAILGLASFFWMATVPLDASRFLPGDDVGKFLTESYKSIMPNSPIRRILPPVFNSYGTLLLVGGAVYSAYLFFRKQVLPNRVIGNVLIALGGILPAAGGSLIKIAETVPALSQIASVAKYTGIFAGALLLFAGFQYAAAPAPPPRYLRPEPNTPR